MSLWFGENEERGHLLSLLLCIACRIGQRDASLVYGKSLLWPKHMTISSARFYARITLNRPCQTSGDLLSTTTLFVS